MNTAPTWTTGAWTAEDAAALLEVTETDAQRTLDAAVDRGECTRLTCGDTTAYLPVTIRLRAEEGQR